MIAVTSTFHLAFEVRLPYISPLIFENFCVSGQIRCNGRRRYDDETDVVKRKTEDFAVLFSGGRG